MGRLDDIQAALKTFKIQNKLKYIFMTILELAESFKTMTALWRHILQKSGECFFLSLQDLKSNFDGKFDLVQ